MSLFRRGVPQDPDRPAAEHWACGFHWFEPRRFAAEQASDYRARARGGRLVLEIRKPSCFAWVTSPRLYRDFLLRGRVGFAAGNGHSAAGFVLRYVNEENFYYFLLSERGEFRFDVVFNANPRHLIEWTPAFSGGREELLRPRELRILARGGMFAFFLGDEWIAELADDTIGQGQIGFAGQNYEDTPAATLQLEHLELESRPPEVERQYYRWVRLLPPEPARRARLAETFFGMGRYTEAAVQLLEARRERAERAERGPEPAEALMLARSYRQLRDYPAALESVEQALAREPAGEAALLEKANLLFLKSDFLACRDFILSILPRFACDAQLHHLLGNCRYSLGDFPAALESFREAAALAPEAPVYRVNVGRTLERLGQASEALSCYLQAAPLLFRGEMFDELSLVIARARALEPLAPEAEALDALEGRMLFQEGRLAEAEDIFHRLLAGQCSDSAVAYLYALILIGRGERARAEGYLEQAAALEPGFALYWFRLAENRFLGGREPGGALEHALAVGPDDPWVNNLAGQWALQQGRAEEALGYLQRARDLAPGEADICANLAEALRTSGRVDAACRELDRGLQAAQGQGAARLYNQRGNCLAQRGEHAAAHSDYERALDLDPENRDYMENCAACCLELDLILRAEELLNRLLEEDQTPSLLNLAGNLAAVQREFERARLAYQEGLKLEPDHLELGLNLLSLHLELGEEAQAREVLAGLKVREPVPPRLGELERRLREKFEVRLTCDGCGREWWVPRQLPEQPAFTLHGEPPPDAPAGRCEACGRLYCIGCAAPHVREGRLHCPRCGQRLRLKEESLKYLVLQSVREQGP